MLERIQKDPIHPLKFLLDKNGKWYKGGRSSQLPTIEAGHVRSRFATEKALERFALEDASWNGMRGNKFETGQKAIIEATVIDIGGVPVEMMTALSWERAFLLRPGTVKNARVVSGWSPLD